MDLVWETIDVKQNKRMSGEPIATISEARISLSPAACALVDNIYSLPYVEIKVAKDENQKISRIGVFLNENKGESGLSVTRRKYKGEFTEGLNINSKSLVNALFGEMGDKTKKYGVTKGGNNLLIIDVQKEL